ncbi:MAG: winged helix DNA-binding domain-containing protein [Rhizobium sp.]|nr:winged helix DNA-binding domain-containing protein [Rhizobium sp.]
MRAQRLDGAEPFGSGPAATKAAVEHLGYVQIDTINVIERSHHHILFSRIPSYRREDLATAQAKDKSVFEYWTHALSYVPVRDYRFFIPAMKLHKTKPDSWYASVAPKDYRALLRRIRDEGALSIRDIDDDVLVEKDHPWASKKPSKRAMQLGFYMGDLVVSRRDGMLKSYDLAERHFGWQRPRPASDTHYAQYLLDRALTAQGIVSLDSICYGGLKWKARVQALINGAVRRKELLPVEIEGGEGVKHWVAPEVLETAPVGAAEGRVHILSPFDPLVIQRTRFKMLFGHDHRFEAYVPAPKRVLGYFALPVTVGDRVVAALDLKTDRKAGKLLIQKWTWLNGGEQAGDKALIEAELARFERFQLAPTTSLE